MLNKVLVRSKAISTYFPALKLTLLEEDRLTQKKNPLGGTYAWFKTTYILALGDSPLKGEYLASSSRFLQWKTSLVTRVHVVRNLWP